MYLYIVLLYTCLALQNGGTESLPSTTPMSKQRMPHKFYSKTAELIASVNKFFNHDHRPVNSGKPMNPQSKRGHFNGREIDEDYYDSKHDSKKEIILLETVMKLLQKNYDVSKNFGQNNKDTIRVHVIRNPEVLESYRKGLRKAQDDRSTSSSSSESTDEDYFDRKMKEMLLRRNSVNFRLASDVSSEGTLEDVDGSKITRSLPKSVEAEVTPFKLPFEYDEMKNMEILINSAEFTNEEKKIEPKENVPVAPEAPEVPADDGAWDMITKNYKWGEEPATGKSTEDRNWENTKRRETANSWEKKDNDRSKKNNDWDKKDKSYEKKDDWNKKSDDWKKKENSWEKKDDWNKKSEDRNKKSDDWNKKNDDWNKKSDDWNKKSDDWNKKPDDWNKKSDDWNKKSDDWNKKSDDWNKKSDDWNKKSDDRNKESDDWNKKSDTWDKKNDWNKRNDDDTKKTNEWDKPANDWNRESNWDTKEKKTTENWDKKDKNWNREDDWTTKNKKNNWDKKDDYDTNVKRKKDDDWDKPTRDWDNTRDRKGKKNDWDILTTKDNDWDRKRDDWDVKNTDRDKTDLRTNKKDTDYKRKNKWEDDWKEKKNHQSSERDKTKGLDSYEKETTKDGKVKKKGNEWDGYIPKSDDYYKPKKSKRVDSYERSPPAAGSGGHAFGRTPIPFAGKKRIYDK